MRQSVALEDWNSATDTFSNFSNEAADSTTWVHTQGSSVHDSQTLDTEAFKHELSDLGSRALGGEGRVRHEHIHILVLQV